MKLHDIFNSVDLECLRAKWWTARRIQAEHFGSEEITKVSLFFPFSLITMHGSREARIGQYFSEVN